MKSDLTHNPIDRCSEEKPWERKTGYLLIMLPGASLTVASFIAMMREDFAFWPSFTCFTGALCMLMCCLRIIAVDIETAFKKALKEALEKHE